MNSIVYFLALFPGLPTFVACSTEPGNKASTIHTPKGRIELGPDAVCDY